MNHIHGNPDGEATGKKSSKKEKAKPLNTSINEPMIIKVRVPTKVQIPMIDPLNGPLQVCDRKKDFVCLIYFHEQPKEYQHLVDVIHEKGAVGLKGYFVAELLAEDQLAIKVCDILALQPW